MKVLVNTDLTDTQLARIREANPGGKVVVALDNRAARDGARDADVIFGRVTPELFEHAPMLRWVQTLGAGVDGTLFPELVESDVILTSEKGYVGPHLAEHTFALLLSLTRGIARSIREKRWDNRMSIRGASWELTDRTLGIVGFGGTGREVAHRAVAFGMKVIAVDPVVTEKPPIVEVLWGMDRFHDLLARSDAVSICAPLTPETRGMFDEAAFRKMQKHSVLVNVTRGAIVDDAALLKALREGWIAGAALDVTPIEPLPADHPLWDMENVVITPHTAGASPYRMDRTVGLFCENLARLSRGESLISVIDKRRGF